jgi:hypothetical protein
VAPFAEPKQRASKRPWPDHVIEFTTSLTPLKEGILTIGPVTAALGVAVRHPRRTFRRDLGEEMQPAGGV